ncbi:MAG TPA: outer membrane beta-barrel protein [Kofleriaceae bacterium]|nr:outer membrane beta-barrel protein [Kofleriaceae bacterium]
MKQAPVTFVLASALVLGGAVSTATADDSAAPAGMAVGVDLELAPSGSITTQFGSSRSTTDAAASYGIGGLFDVGVSRYLSVGFAPRYLLNVKTSDSQNNPGGSNDTATELDLRARIAAHIPIANKLQGYGYVSPGYSIIFAPSNSNSSDNPAGLSLGFGGGVAYQINPTLALTGELGYQVGYQSVTVDVLGIKSDIDFETRYLHFGVGLVMAIDNR